MNLIFSKLFHPLYFSAPKICCSFKNLSTNWRAENVKYHINQFYLDYSWFTIFSFTRLAVKPLWKLSINGWKPRHFHDDFCRSLENSLGSRFFSSSEFRYFEILNQWLDLQGYSLDRLRNTMMGNIFCFLNNPVNLTIEAGHPLKHE